MSSVVKILETIEWEGVTPAVHPRANKQATGIWSHTLTYTQRASVWLTLVSSVGLQSEHTHSSVKLPQQASPWGRQTQTQRHAELPTHANSRQEILWALTQTRAGPLPPAVNSLGPNVRPVWRQMERRDSVRQTDTETVKRRAEDAASSCLQAVKHEKYNVRVCQSWAGSSDFLQESHRLNSFTWFYSLSPYMHEAALSWFTLALFTTTNGFGTMKITYW